MFGKSTYCSCLLATAALMVSAHAGVLSPDDASIRDNLCLWLRNPSDNFDPATGIWTDLSGKGHDAEPAGEIFGFGITYVAPTLSSGADPDVFENEFSTVRFAREADDLLRAPGLNEGSGLSRLTIITTYMVDNVNQSGVDTTRPVGFGSIPGEDGNNGNNFNLAVDLSVRKDNGAVTGATATHPHGQFFIRAARMNGDGIQQWLNTNGTLAQVHDSPGSIYTTSTDNFYLGDLRAGNSLVLNQYARTDVEIAEVIVYNTALTDEQIEGIVVWLQAWKKASGPTPEDGSIHNDTAATLTWNAGVRAVSHDVYFGTAFDAVNDGAEGTFLGNTADTSLIVGEPDSLYAAALEPGVTYYWRVDEVNDAEAESPWKGEVWSFRVRPATAWDPTPIDAGLYVSPDRELNWKEGLNVLFHTVYFGNSFEEVEEATTSGITTTSETYVPDTLELGQTYYWRVDEYDMSAATHKGEVWSFTTMPEVAVTDPNLRLWWTFDEGQGTNAVDWSGHGNHGVIEGTGQWTPEGYCQSALRLDGDDKVVCTFAEEETWPAFTVALWAKAAETGQAVYTSTFNNNSSGPDFQFDVDGTIPGNYRYYGSSGNEVFGPVRTEWIHLAASCDGTSTTLYYDGQQGAAITAADTNFCQFVVGTNRADSKAFAGVIDDVYVYDKALTAEEIQQLMQGNSRLANDPTPAREALVDIRDATSLSWSAGATAASHDVYFGTDREAVLAADSNSAEYQGNQAGTSLSLTGLAEFGGGTYYWRVDEVAADGTIDTGTLWSFSVPDYLIVDDFESYTNLSPNRLFQTWVDGLGFSPDDFFPDGHPGNGTAALVGHDIWTEDYTMIVEAVNTHGGDQAMPLYYDNAQAPYYSETERTWLSAQNWTIAGVTDLTLYVRGASSNGAAPVYVALEDGAGNVAVVTHSDAALLTQTNWSECKIPLADFVGVDTASVKRMIIGAGSRTSPTAGGSGIIYVDDIRVVAP